MIEQKARRPNLGHRFRQSLYLESSRWQLRRLRLDTRINSHIRQSAPDDPTWKPEKLGFITIISAIPDISKSAKGRERKKKEEEKSHWLGPSNSIPPCLRAHPGEGPERIIRKYVNPLPTINQ